MKITGSKKLTSTVIYAVVVVLSFVHLAGLISLEESEAPEARLADAYSVLSVSSAQPGKTYRAAVIVDVTPGWHINSAYPSQEGLIATEIEFGDASLLTPSGLDYPTGHDLDLGGMLMSVYDGTVAIPFDVSVSENAEAGEATLPVEFTYQPCNNKECRAPQTISAELRVTIGDEGQPIHQDIFGSTALVDSPEQGSEAAYQQQSDLEILITKYGFWGYIMALGLAFLTGLLLSFSPCTYPMIPITVSIFAGQNRTIWRGFIMSLFYVGSMAVVYGLMGMIVSMVGGVFGAWLASTPVVIGIVIVFVIFSLSMFGLYELNVPNSIRQKMGGGQAKGGIGGAIVLGVVAAMVVSPCVGPFVAGIMLYIATYGSPLFGFLVLFVFACGLGTLYILIGTFSSAINSLPNSGEWMDQVKKFFGFVLLLMALYFLNTIVSDSLIALLTGLLMMAFAVFGGGLDRLTPDSAFFQRLKKFFGLLAMLIGIYLLLGTMIGQGFIFPPASKWLPASGNVSDVEKSLIDWETDLESGLKRAADQGKPVLIDTWATWCVNCRVLEKKTFGNAEVASEIGKRFVPLKIQLEKADSPETKAFMARFNLKYYSLPTTLILNSQGKVINILPGVIEPEELIRHLQKAD